MIAAIFVVSMLAWSDPSPQKDLPEAAKKELRKLEGKWKIVKMARAGTEIIPKKEDVELVVEIKEGKWTLNGQLKAEIVAIDTSTNPKCLDMKSLEKGRKGVVEEGVYKLDADVLTITWYQGEGKNRPSSFDTPKDRNTILAVMKRIKDEPKKTSEKQCSPQS